MEGFKSFYMTLAGLLAGVMFVVCAVGSISCLIAAGRYFYAASTLLVIFFAAKPIRDFFLKSIM